MTPRVPSGVEGSFFDSSIVTYTLSMGNPQIAALDVIAQVEGFWTEPLTTDLAARIALAPERKLVSFLNERALTPIFAEDHLLNAGEVRPVIPRHGREESQRAVALHMLLYTDSILLDTVHLFPIDEWFVGAPGVTPKGRRVLQSGYAWLASVRPLIEAGAIYFRTSSGPGATSPNAPDLLARNEGYLRPGFTPEAFDEMVGANILETRGSMDAARLGIGTVLAANEQMNLGMHSLLANQLTVDRRLTQLSTLAQLGLPSLEHTEVRSLVSVRSDAESFKQFRDGLGDALSEIVSIPDGDDGPRQAAQLVSARLLERLSAVEREIAGSTALSLLKNGTRNLLMSGIGVGAAAATMSATATPIVGGLTTAAASTAVQYLTERRKKRQAQAIWDLVLSLQGP